MSDKLPVIVGSGLSGMAISDWLTRGGVDHIMIGAAPNNLPRLGESIDPAGTLELLKYYPEYDQFYYRKAWITVFLGNYATSCDFSQNFNRVVGLKLLGFDSPPEFIHVDRVGFDNAFYERVTASPHCHRIEALVDKIIYDETTDLIQEIHLNDGQVLEPRYVYDCTNHVRLLGRALNIPLKTISEPQRVVFDHFRSEGDVPLCDTMDLDWLHSTNILRLYEDIDGINGLSWLIPLGPYVSAGVSMPKDDNDCPDEEVIALLAEAYARRGIPYKELFPHPTKLMSVPYQQYFFHDRAYGKNWLLAGPSYGQVWFPSASGVGAALVAGYIAEEIIERPDEIGQLYQDYIIGLQESHMIFDRMIKRHYTELTPELVKMEANRIVSENVKRVARLASIQSSKASAAFGRALIKAVSREGVGGSSCVVFDQDDMGRQAELIFKGR
ncbi:MAG: NAD(P)/FAD-dependent oxidoreductase [Candidatus Promineifilaceae bacterium]